MKGYKFDTEIEAKSATEAINLAAGMPKNEGSITRSWTAYNKAELNDPEFFFIMHDAFTETVLGEPEELNIIFSEE